MLADNIFLKIIDKSIPAKIAYEDDLLPRVSRHQAASADACAHHSRRKSSARSTTRPTRISRCSGTCTLVAVKLAKQLGLSKGYRLVVNCNEHGGQTVPHLHVHLLGGRDLHLAPRLMMRLCRRRRASHPKWTASHSCRAIRFGSARIAAAASERDATRAA